MNVMIWRRTCSSLICLFAIVFVWSLLTTSCGRNIDPVAEKTVEKIPDQTDGGITPDDNTTKPDDNTTKPDDNTTKPDDNTTKPDDNTQPSGTMIKDLRDTNSPNYKKKGDTAVLKGVVATTPVFYVSANLNGFFVANMPMVRFGGVMIVVPNDFAQEIQIGDELDIEGYVDEYYHNIQVNASAARGGSVVKTGKNRVSEIEPIVITTQDFASTPDNSTAPNSSKTEQFEGTLVELRDIIVEAEADQYGVWKITGGIVIDDSIFRGFKPKKDTQLKYVRGVVQYSFDLYRILPRSYLDIDTAAPECKADDDCGTGRRCNNFGQCVQIKCSQDSDCKAGEVCHIETQRCNKTTKSLTIMQIQNPNEPGHPKKDDPVALEGVIVTTTIFKVSANLNGFFVSAPSFPDKFGGVMVVVGIDWTETLQIGDELNISGRVTEYFNNTQIQVTISQGQSITKTGNNKKDQIKAIEVQAADIKAIPADDKNPDASPSEAYEGMLVELKNVIIEDQYLEGTKKEFKGSWTTTDGVIIANTLFDIKPTKGDKYSVVRGVIQYTFNAFRLLPRSADDVQKTP